MRMNYTTYISGNIVAVSVRSEDYRRRHNRVSVPSGRYYTVIHKGVLQHSVLIEKELNMNNAMLELHCDYIERIRYHPWKANEIIECSDRNTETDVNNKMRMLRFVGPFKVIKRVGDVAYKLELPEELSRVHNTFHVSNLKKCHADEPLAVLLDGLHFDDKLQFVEEPIEIIDREVKRLKQSRIPLVKVRWNSKRGPEFTWEREDQFRKKYPHLFSKTGPSSSAAS
ncbi:hypothetical protein Tco_1091779 [Tanacetum coccineum]|uniref:Tf2-1-like SH3-like domain-containing protein n=1 Tax=Tanacetum coccineum TaxID=301880 RepID=A0ABQ5I848_9ASTR